MKKFTFIFVFLLMSLISKAQKVENIISHDAVIIVTDPSKGENPYKKMAAFPSKDEEIRKIVLNLRFECPGDSLRCADWDYSDHIFARPVQDSTVYEIARMITPYGGRFRDGWSFDWQVDVTDFSNILRDKVEITYNHSGYEDPKTLGWKITLDFEITYGKPVAEVTEIHTLYNANFKYGDVNDPIEHHLKPVKIQAKSKTKFTKIRVHQTGHGMDENGCGEFCSKYRDILVDGKLLDRKDLWMECGDNPLYPQAGTWIFDRANWCPGYLVQPDEIIFYPEAEYTVDINMEEYEVEKPSAKEDIWAYAIEYGKINSKNDVELVEILFPSAEKRFSRIESFTGHPIIKIKNNGKSELKQLAIRYGIEGEEMNLFDWKGSLAFGEAAIISLPKSVYSKSELAKFVVDLQNPNGKKDEYVFDNRGENEYVKPDQLPHDIIVEFKTNKKLQNTYSIMNGSGEIVFSRDSLKMEKETTYRDTIHLSEGLYTFHVIDEAGDGLEFWYKARDGKGAVRILDTLGQAIQFFDPDFGSGIQYHFMVQDNEDYHLEEEALISLFPGRTRGPVEVEYFSNEQKDIQVIIVPEDDESKIVEQHTYFDFARGNLTFDLSYLPKKRYYLKVIIDGNEIFKNRIRLGE